MTSANNSCTTPSNPSPLYQTNLPWVFSDFYAIFSGEGIHAIQRQEPVHLPRVSFPPEWEKEIKRTIETGVPLQQVPLKPSGTPFQQKVWSALLQIPRGTTVTYGELAQKIGAPGASRAVGNACGKNPIPFLIPCHRVVCAGGKLGGYAFGVAVKNLLIGREAL